MQHYFYTFLGLSFIANIVFSTPPVASVLCQGDVILLFIQGQGGKERLHLEDCEAQQKIAEQTGQRDLSKATDKEDDLKKLLDEHLSPLPFKKGWALPADAPYESEYDPKNF